MQIGFIIGCIGTWLLSDGVASLWQYTRPERKDNQSWLRDHSFRILRCCLGIILIWIGYIL